MENQGNIQGAVQDVYYQRKSLVCGIVEPFRIIVDRQLKNAFNLNQIKDEDFKIENGQYLLRYDKSKAYTQWLVRSVLEYKGEIFTYLQQYYRESVLYKNYALF